jgi:ABC-type glycerol-3-phosphate transport system substrate-binding protein
LGNKKEEFLKMKRIRTLCIVALLLVSFGGVAFANGQKETAVGSQKAETITLRVVDWSDSSITFREAFNKQFEEKHPGVKVEYTCLTVDQFKNTIITMIKSGDGPDLFPIPSGMTLSTALKEEWYQSMSPYLSEDFLETINPEAFADGITMDDGQIYTFPENAPLINSLFFYNKDVLDAAGVTTLPRTYSEFRAVCKQVTDAGKGQYYGLIEGGIQLNRLETLARAFASMAGGKLAPPSAVLTVNGESNLNSPQMKGALEFLSNLVADGTVHPDTVSINAPTAREMFAQGQAAFLMQGMWCIPTWGNTYPDMNYGVIAPPVPDGQTVTYGCQAAALAPWMGVYKQSKHPELAAEYMKALYSEEYGYQAAQVKAGNSISLVSAVNDKTMSNKAQIEFYQAAKANTRIVPIATTRDEKAFGFYAEVKDVTPSLGSIVQGVLAQSFKDYGKKLDTLNASSVAEWKRAASAIGLDYSVFEFPNWDLSKNYTDADYAALK